MNCKFIQYKVISSLCLTGLLLIGCDSQPKSTSIVAPRIERYTQTMDLEGLVTDDHGPVKNGIVKAIDEKGHVLAISDLQGRSRYTLQVPTGTVLPLIVAYYPHEDANDEQRMMTVAIHANTSKYDINPASTRIAKQAKALGGYTHNNWVRAAEASGTVPPDNKTTAGFRGDPTTQYGGWH